MSIQTLADLQSYVSMLVNDPSNTRYTIPLINSQLDLAQHRWNMEAKICRITNPIPIFANQFRYSFPGIFPTYPIQILRATFKGVPLNLRSKEYFDRYSASDWTTATGTPQEICIDLNSNNLSADNQLYASPSVILHPTPTANDVTNYSNSVGLLNQPPLVVETLCQHLPMVNSTDTPFSSGALFPNMTIVPYLAGLGLDVAASLLEPDPTAETVSKAKIFRGQANSYLSLVVQMYQGLEEDIPGRMNGGRSWQMGIAGNVIP